MADFTDVDAVRVALSPGGDDTDVGSAASLSDEDLQVAVDDSTDEINGKITARYGSPLPFTTPPTILARISRDIAAYFATLTYRRGDPIITGDPVQLRYNAAEALLTQIQNGTIVIDAGNPSGEADLLPIFVDPSNTTLYDGDNGPIDYPPVVGGPRFLLVE